MLTVVAGCLSGRQFVQDYQDEMRRGIFICRCKNQPYFVVRVEKMPIFAVSIETVPRWVYDTEEREAHPNASFNWL